MEEDPPAQGLSRTTSSSFVATGASLLETLLRVGAHVRAEVLRARREAADLTQDEAAHLAEISVSTWSNLENPAYKTFRPRTLRKALRALHVPEDLELPQSHEAANAEEIIETVVQLPFGSGKFLALAQQNLGQRIDAAASVESGRESRTDEIAGKLQELDEKDLDVVGQLVERLRERG